MIVCLLLSLMGFCLYLWTRRYGKRSIPARSTMTEPKSDFGASNLSVATAAGPHTLFVCNKCQSPDFMPESCDIEDLPNSGCLMYKKLLQRTRQCPNWKEISVEEPEGSAFRCGESGCILRIKPTRCLSACDYPNCIALRAPGKYSYQFGSLGVDAVPDIMTFTNDYVRSTDGFSKTRSRPTKLRKTILSRIPPE